MKKKASIQPIRGKQGGTVLGPSNPARENENPDIVVPPSTDYGTFPNLRWSFADSHMRLEEGGWSRETTIREFPASPSIAAVNMRLNAGGVREMHWHREAEWSYMLKGNARITSVDEEGRTFQDDVEEGDIWYFPAGIPHSIQGLGPDGCEFLLVFDDGNFTENSTFQLTDWLAHTPKEIIAKNFGLPKSAFANIPKKELYIFQTDLPGSLKKTGVIGNGPMPLKFSHKFLAQKPLKTKSGTVRVADSSVFPISKTIAAGLVEIEPGGMRELHWHSNTDEWQYYISGTARMTVFAGEGCARTFNFQAGDVGAVPFPMSHYVENTGTETLRFLEIFKSDYFADISLAKWLAFTPHELVCAHLNIDPSILKKIPKEKKPIVP
ncbi:MAG: oxalate decarboxylase family bicupin [Chlamydiia bacterium]